MAVAWMDADLTAFRSVFSGIAHGAAKEAGLVFAQYRRSSIRKSPESSYCEHRMNRIYTGIVVAEQPAIGNRPLLRFCPIGEADRRLRLTGLDTGDIGLLAEEELDLTPYIG